MKILYGNEYETSTNSALSIPTLRLPRKAEVTQEI